MSSSQQWRTAAPEQLARVCAVFADLAWPIHSTAVPGLVTHLGWQVVSDPDDRFMEADTGWDLSMSLADVACDNGELTTVSFPITDVIDEATIGGADFLNDSFVQALRTISDSFGRADEVTSGTKMYARWDMSNRGLIVLSGLSRSVGINVSSAEWAEVSRRTGE